MSDNWTTYKTDVFLKGQIVFYLTFCLMTNLMLGHFAQTHFVLQIEIPPWQYPPYSSPCLYDMLARVQS